MTIGFVGLGKLGLPCALAIESKSHIVIGYDTSPNVKRIIQTRKLPYKEVGAQELLDKSYINLYDNISDIVADSDIIFVSIQTPHIEKYEGITRIPKERVDFDYSYLKEGIKEISNEVNKLKEDRIVIIISTVIPGTISREIKPLLNKYIKLCYNPFFIAMGTTINDFLNPEFVLFGVDKNTDCDIVKKFYRTIHDKPFVEMSIESAELTKVAYNTMITSKIVIVNTLMEICHKIPNADIDEVTDALKLATDRVISTKYMDGGMGDGGGCHPRDNIALSWLSRKLDLSYDIYDSLMISREKQTEWFAKLIIEQYDNTAIMNVTILGKSFKSESNITVGSPAILLKNILNEIRSDITVYIFDPYIDIDKLRSLYRYRSIYFIGTNHKIFKTYDFSGSIVIDPWRIIKPKDNFKLISIGKK